MYNASKREHTIEYVLSHFLKDSCAYGGWPIVARKSELCEKTLRKNFKNSIKVEKYSDTHVRLSAIVDGKFKNELLIEFLRKELTISREERNTLISGLRKLLDEAGG